MTGWLANWVTDWLSRIEVIFFDIEEKETFEPAQELNP